MPSTFTLAQDKDLYGTYFGDIFHAFPKPTRGEHLGGMKIFECSFVGSRIVLVQDADLVQEIFTNDPERPKWMP